MKYSSLLLLLELVGKEDIFRENTIMLPVELPLWIDEKYTNENSIYCNRTYRYIVELFFSKTKTIYHTVTFNNIGYVEHAGGTSFAFSNRSTYLISLIELIDEDRMKYIFKLFLERAANINFFHPSNNYNSLIILKKMLRKTRHSDVMDILLRRNEIREPDVLLFLSECIQEGRHNRLFLNTLFKIRYGKYFWFWVHRVYRPGSKLYQRLSAKYAEVMPAKPEKESEDTEMLVCVNKFKNRLNIHPYKKIKT